MLVGKDRKAAVESLLTNDLYVSVPIRRPTWDPEANAVTDRCGNMCKAVTDKVDCTHGVKVT